MSTIQLVNSVIDDFCTTTSDLSQVLNAHHTLDEFLPDTKDWTIAERVHAAQDLVAQLETDVRNLEDRISDLECLLNQLHVETD
jgi:hypothetical protein